VLLIIDLPANVSLVHTTWPPLLSPLRQGAACILAILCACVADDPGGAEASHDVTTRFRTGCEHREPYFGEAAGWRYLGSENFLLYQDVYNFTASTRDGGISVDPSRGDRIDGTLALQSRSCGPPPRPSACNVVGFDGTLLGVEVSPLQSATAVHDDGWCWDADAPLWFSGIALLDHVDRALFVYAEDAGIEEPDGDPVANPDAVVYGLDVQVWEVPTDCGLGDVPCGAGMPLATGRLLRSDRLPWRPAAP
jgi:hypothetical protein